MFLLLFYCGLLSTVVSADFNNDTSHDGDELDINTTLSTLPSTTISVSKDCVLEMKENEISQIVELFNSNLVNVVVIHISFSNSSHEGELLSDFNVSLSSPVGREILYALERWQFRYFPWTLKAGIRNFKLNVHGSQNDCIKTGKNASNFVLESTQHIIDNVNLAINYQACSSFKESLSGKVKQTCCHMIKHNLATEFNCKCPKGKSFFFESDLLWLVIFYMTLIFSSFYLMWLLLVLLSRTEFNLEYPEYYKLEESMMSPSTILIKVIWDENGRVVSFIRSLVLVGVFSYSLYLESWTGKQNTNVSIFFTSLFVFWGLSFLVSNLFRSMVTDSSEILKRIKERRNNFFVNTFVMHSVKNKREYFETVVKVIIQPFNPYVWKPIIKILCHDCKAFVTYKTRRFRNSTLKTLALCFYSVLALLICFVCVSIVFCLLTCFSIFLPVLLVVMLLHVTYLTKYRDNNCSKNVLSWFQITGLFLLFVESITIIAHSILSFLLGLFLNLFHFIPFIAFFSVLTFYCSTYWKIMEEKYFVLKQLIYEACREAQNINNGCTPNRHPKPGEKVLLVVSSKLYDKIKEEFLPYDTNLFYFGLKMFWAIAFSLGILALINMFNEFNVTGLVQVVTTASLGVMPQIFNMVGSKTSEAKTKAHNENLKLNVKYMVQELIREDPELARTVLIKEQDLDDYKTPANPLLVRILRNPLHRYRPDNNYVEDCEQGPPLSLQEINTMTDDENTKNSEHFETMFGISFSDNDDIEDIEPDRTRTVRRNNAITTHENSKNSENAHARLEANSNDDFEDDEPDRIVIVHRNNESTTVENVHTGNESNLDNTDIEDNGLSITVIVDENHETTTVENAHARRESNYDNDIEDNGLPPILMVDRNHETTTVENAHVRPESNRDNNDIEDNGLPPIVMVDRNHESTTVENAHVRPESNRDNNDIEDNGLSPTVMVDRIHEGRNYENVENFENSYDSFISHPDNDDVVDDEQAPIEVVHRNEARNDENSQTVYAMPDLNPNDDETQALTMFTIQQDDVKDDEQTLIVVAHRNDATNDENSQTLYAMPDLNPNDDDDTEHPEAQPLILHTTAQ